MAARVAGVAVRADEVESSEVCRVLFVGVCESVAHVTIFDPQLLAIMSINYYLIILFKLDLGLTRLFILSFISMHQDYQTHYLRPKFIVIAI